MATVDGNVISMGPAGDQWRYFRKQRTYDLTRDGEGEGEGQGKGDLGSKAVIVQTAAGPADTHIALAPAKTALVIVDMQNFFLHPRCRDHPTGLAAVAPTLRAIDACRAAGIKIIWLNWGLTDDDLATMPAAVVRGFARSMLLAASSPESADDPQTNPPPAGLGVDLGDGRGRTLVRGEWNTAVYEGPLAAAVRPDLGDVWCDKNRISGMVSTAPTSLSRYLAHDPHGRGVRTLLFAGVNTDQCVLGTLADCYNAGWDCVAVADCCATGTPNGQTTSLWNIGNTYGFVIDSQTLADGVQAYTEAKS